MSIERADTQYARNSKNKRKVRIGGITRERSYSAVEIARALKQGKLAELEARSGEN
jgi:hypothetical protein